MTGNCDVIIIGGGPAGLALAAALAGGGLRATLVERSTAAVLADPPVDGREIALTHRSRRIMRQLGIWDRIPADEISLLRGAQVEQGGSPHHLRITPQAAGDPLGFMIPNYQIRRAAHAAVRGLGDAGPELITGVGVTGVRVEPGAARVTLDDGRSLTAPLVVAADSRFSEARRAAGIAAHLHDFGRAVIVCRMRHEVPNDGVAHECFHIGRTLAILPLGPRLVSVVFTLKSPDADAVMRTAGDVLANEVAQQFGQRLGRMELVGELHRYPLVAVYARRFIAPRFALLGDAAVGMHPVTAHGYNFGLYGVDSLTRALRAARAGDRDIGAEAVLRHYEREHRSVTLPIFLGTNALVKLYTDDRRPARAVRRGLLRVANRLPPVKGWIARQLGEA